MTVHESGCAETLAESLGPAVSFGNPESVTNAVKNRLIELIADGSFRLPERFHKNGNEGYARRLLHRDDDLGYTVVVMTWAPGQGTSLHDHAGMWCVECVVEGELEIVQFDLLTRESDRYRFERRGRTRAKIGDAGCLIPPYEYHTIQNPLDDRSAISMHVYGGQMDHCNLYVPRDDGWWHKQPRQLSYDG